jgi:hypothetical protein
MAPRRREEIITMRVRVSILGIAVSLFAVAALAAAANEPKEAEYVVYVESLGLRAEPSPEADVIAVLGAGERVVATDAEPAHVGYDYGWEFWYEVRAGDKVGWVGDRSILPADVYDVVASATVLDDTGEPYVVWGSDVDLRANPGAAARTLTTLPAGTTVADTAYEVLPLEDGFWRLVRAGEMVGWVPDRRILLADYYEAFRKADELGKAGDAGGMIAAIEEGNKKMVALEGLAEYERPRADVSPDGLKVMLDTEGEGPGLWRGGYPGGGRAGSPWPGFFFVSGRGLVEYFRSYDSISAMWSPDSRYLLYSELPVVEFPDRARLTLLDTETWNRVTVGYNDLTQGWGEFGFGDGYVLWIDEEPVKEPGPPPLERESYTPVLWGYDIAAGKAFRVLAADLTTVKEKPVDTHGFTFGVAYYEVKMAPAGPCPPAVAYSTLYKKYNGAFARASNREYWGQ